METAAGSLKEIGSIANYFTTTHSIIRSDANEDNIKELSDNGNLLQYDIIHFATHGVVIPDIPELSSIVLSQRRNLLYEEDGY